MESVGHYLKINLRIKMHGQSQAQCSGTRKTHLMWPHVSLGTSLPLRAGSA